MQRRAEHLSRQLQVGLDHLAARHRTLATRSKAVGDREQGDVDAHGLGGPQVVVHPAPGERPLLDHEPESQVMKCERLEMAPQSPARLQAPAHLRDDLDADTVVPDEGDEVAAPLHRRRLAAVVDQRPEAQGAATGQAVAERLRQQLPHLPGVLAGKSLQVALDLEQLAQYLDRVPVDVEVVVGSLLDSAQSLELGQYGPADTQLVDQLQAPQRLRAGHEQGELGELALPGRLCGASRLGSGELQGCGIERQAQLRSQPRRPQQSQGVIGEAALRDGPQDAPLEVGHAVIGVQRRAPLEGNRHRPDGEVTRREVGLDRLAAKPGHVGQRAAVAVDDAPGAEAVRQREGVPTRLACKLLRSSLLPASDGEVEVLHLPAHRGGADGAANYPGFIRLHRAPGQADRLSGEEALRQPRGAHPSAAPVLSLGTRGEIPQVTS
jgi:hypothetical protein